MNELKTEENKCAFEVSASRCSVLTSKNCAMCAFFKNKQSLEDGRENAKDRLERTEGGKKLINKYHKGDY